MAPLILVTGFGPFAGLKQNPSALVAHDVSRARVPGVRLVARVLPVSYAGAEARVAALCRRLHPDAVLSLGVAIGAPVIRVETTALNRADFRSRRPRRIHAARPRSWRPTTRGPC
jgi:pyroglutamyl-peptidase